MPKTSLYLQPSDVDLLTDLAAEYGSKSEAVRVALAALARSRIDRALTEKYRAESPMPDSMSKIQSETASDLGEYPW